MSDYEFHFTVSGITREQAEKLLAVIIHWVEIDNIFSGKDAIVAGGFVKVDDKQEASDGQTTPA